MYGPMYLQVQDSNKLSGIQEIIIIVVLSNILAMFCLAPLD